MKQLLLTMMALLFVLAACGTDDLSNGDGGNQGNLDDQTGHQTNPNDHGGGQVIDQPEELTEEELLAMIDQLNYRTAVQPDIEQTIFTMELINTGDDTVELGFSSGQQFEIVVTNAETGEEVYRYSEGRAFTEAFVYKPVEPGQSLTWKEVWEYGNDIQPGTYNAEVTILASQINKQVIEGQPFVKQFSFEIPEEKERSAFRNVKVEGTAGKYKVTGEARVSEGGFMYHVEDGHNLLVEDTPVQVAEDADSSWSEFELDIEIPEEQLPVNGTLTLVLYEENKKEGKPGSQHHVTLEQIIQ